MDTKNDFSKGSVTRNILKIAVPMTFAQLINILYNIVDRLYIGRIPENAFLALTGLGICLPVISLVIAFTNLFGIGGAPLCSIARGEKNTQKAERIIGNSFTMLVACSVAITALALLFKRRYCICSAQAIRLTSTRPIT
jgi:Na+-driven multidrug efflux pump